MKTQQLMIRTVEGIEVRQNHKTEMFCLTDLAKRVPEKQMNNWLTLQSTQEFIMLLCERYRLSREQVISTRRGRKHGGTWTHPLLFLDFAMWVSPKFKLAALEWLRDELCFNRDLAGDGYKTMCEAIEEVFKPNDGKTYALEAMMVQRVARVLAGERNLADAKKLSSLNKAQKANAKLIRQGIKEIWKREAKLTELLSLDE